MDNLNAQLSIKLVGDDTVSPASLSASELADIISSYEKSLISEIERNNDTALDNKPPIVSLVRIEKGSIQLGFYSDCPCTVPAFYTITTAIVNKNFNTLSDKTVSCLNKIKQVIEKRAMSANFYVEHNATPLATISADTEIIQKITYVTGETTLYGKITRVGGNDPVVRLEVDANNIIHCKVEKNLAIELANYLYQRVRLIGEAKWNMSDYSIKAFTITEFDRDYRETHLSEFLADFSQKGHYYKDIDPVAYIDEMRSED
ncbi:hypothetical protein [Candidatus Albibeggiatoa sp. nov. BB20]|uniref:hypothetical protein n=1 Tax=Candidatus Albibeggiatoa sp. nov. BB20 TaxID=3162723 RepID=UPI00336537B3